MSIDEDGRINVSLFGISDMEMLAVVDDLADEEGWTLTYNVRVQLGENPEPGAPRSGVGVRLAWMRRYGWLEREGVKAQEGGRATTRWRLTPVGQTLLDNPKLAAGFQAAMARMNPAQRLTLTRELAEGADNGAREVRDALRRQWTRSLGVRR